MVTRVTDLRNAQGDYRSLDDRMLVLDFQAGHPEAFVEIHRRYGQLARHVCHRLLMNRADADEAFQEAMIRVFQGLHRFNGRYALQPWIARIATNVSLDQIRARARRPQLEDGSFEEDERRDPADGPEEAFEKLVERDLVLSVLSGLPASHRTALVLRELEGRSHKEIGETLGITPSQAKALIHRAKGSFRRGWLKAMAEKGGLAGIAVLPLMWLARVGDQARRLVERVGGHAGQVAQAATPEIVSSAASSPAVATAATGVTERVIAAGMTLILAGGVTVGAATIAKRGRDRESPERAAAAPVVTQEPQRSVPIQPEPSTVPVKEKKEPTREKKVEETPAAEPPVVVTLPSPEPEVSPSPETSPSPSPTPTPIPPAPAWGLKFGSSVGLGAGPFARVSSRVSGKAGQNVIFSETVAAPRTDGEGNSIGRVYVEYWGSTEGATGSANLWVFIDTPAGTYRLDATGDLTDSGTRSDGTFGYVFEGYYFVATQLPPTDEESLPNPAQLLEGTFRLELGFWADAKSLYAVKLQLTEA